MCPCLVVAARRRGLSCPRLAVGRILRPPRPCVAAPARALCARPLRPCRLGGGVVGCPARPVARLLPRLPPLLRRGVGGSLRSLLAFVGVCCVSSLGSCCVLCCAVGPLCARALGWVCAGCFVSPVRPRCVRLRGRGAVFVRRGCWPVCCVLGASLAARVSRLRGAPGSGRVCGFRPGCAGLSGWAWSGVPFAGVAVRRVLSCGRLVVPSLSLLPSAASAAPAVVGFSGGRRLPAAFRPLVSGVVGAVLAAGRSVAVGCAGGADSFVRAAAPGAAVFAVASFGAGRSAFARRSAALVASVAAGGPGSGLVVFPSAPCPAGLLPSPRSSACFCGLGSGSWASAAFAAGLGLPLVVFPCGFSALPPWGAWRPLSGAWSGGFLLG